MRQETHLLLVNAASRPAAPGHRGTNPTRTGGCGSVWPNSLNNRLLQRGRANVFADILSSRWTFLQLDHCVGYSPASSCNRRPFSPSSACSKTGAAIPTPGPCSEAENTGKFRLLQCLGGRHRQAFVPRESRCMAEPVHDCTKSAIPDRHVHRTNARQSRRPARFNGDVPAAAWASLDRLARIRIRKGQLGI